MGPLFLCGPLPGLPLPRVFLDDSRVISTLAVLEANRLQHVVQLANAMWTDPEGTRHIRYRHHMLNHGVYESSTCRP